MNLQDSLYNEFTSLVKIDSPSGNEDRIAEYLKNRLNLLGLQIKEDDFGNIVASSGGVGEPILLSMHMDTVQPGEGVEPHLDGDIIKSSGTTILGGDNKAALAATIIFLEKIYKPENKHRPIDLIITRQEENISLGAKNFDYKLVRGKEGVVLDSADIFGAIIIAAPYNASFDIQINGKSAHVKNIKDGISAAQVASYIVNNLPVGLIGDDTSFNIAYIKAGLSKDNDLILEGSRNSVPNYAVLSGEIRGYNKYTYDQAKDEIVKVSKQAEIKYQASIKFMIDERAVGYTFAENEKLVEKVADSFSRVGVKSFFIKSLGGSDANIFNSNGLKLLVVSSAQHNPHQLDEYVSLSELEKLVAFIDKFVSVDE